MRVLEHFCSFEMCLDIEYFVRRETWSFENSLVSKKTARSDDISLVNLIVAWNLLAKSMKLSISCLLEVHAEKMSSMNLFHMIDL